ncbi:MAG: nuclear transport factor 2 family protein [Methylocystis sp.]
MPEQIPQCQSMDEAALVDANAAYYRAFAARDLGAMSDLWAEDGCSCVHPGWPALVGRTPVLASYRDIFRNPQQEAVTARDPQTLIEGADGRVFCIEEVGGGLLLATNWFRWSGERWRLVHHQAGPLAMAPSSPRREGKQSFH